LFAAIYKERRDYSTDCLVVPSLGANEGSGGRVRRDKRWERDGSLTAFQCSSQIILLGSEFAAPCKEQILICGKVLTRR
jgi:hypothetical protein